MKDESVIPKGLYCYSRVPIYGTKNEKFITCPYWSINENRPVQDNGYCSFMESGDWESDGLSLIWDMVKECGIDVDFDIDPEEQL